MKRKILLFANFLIIMSLVGLILFLTIGGYSFILGKVKISVHHLKNLLFIFLGSWFLRIILLLTTEKDFQRHFFSFFKIPFSQSFSINNSSELNIGKNSLLTALFFFLFFLFMQKLKYEPLIYSNLAQISGGLANSIFSVIFLFFIIFFYFSWAKRSINGDFAFFSTLLFILNPWHTYRGLQFQGYNILSLLFILFGNLFLRPKDSIFKFFLLLSVWILSFQGISFLLDGTFLNDPGLIFFKERIVLFSFGRIGIFLFGISLLFLFWYRQKIFIALLGAMLVALILPLRFPQNPALYFPYISLFSLVVAQGIILILKNQLSNFYSFDRNITFASVVIVLSMCYSYANSNLQRLPERIYEAEDRHSRVGEVKIDKEASSGWALGAFIDRDSPEFMIFGPYRQYFSGSYKADFWMKTDDNTKDAVLATIEVTADAGRTIVGQKNIRGIDFRENNCYQSFTIPFNQTGRKELEFRVFYHQKGNLWVDKVVVNYRNK